LTRTVTLTDRTPESHPGHSNNRRTVILFRPQSGLPQPLPSSPDVHVIT